MGEYRGGSMKNTRFTIDDEVRLVSCKTTIGTIRQVVSVLSDGNTLYLVNFPQGLTMVVEQELELNREIVKTLDNVYLSDLSIVIEVEDKIQEIIDELELVVSDYPSTVLINACKLQRYLVLTNTVVKKYIGSSSKNNLFNELYNGLILGDRNYLTNSLIFKEIMNKLDATVHCVVMMDKDGKFYVSNLVLIEDLYYYFDVTMETELYFKSNEEEFVLSCAGIGKEKYENYFKPISLLDFDVSLPNESLPFNISKDSIDSSVISEIK